MFRRTGIRILAIAFSFMAMGVTEFHAQGTDSGRDIPILVVADDSGDEMIGKGTMISQYINTAIKEQFSRHGYYVVPQEAVEARLGMDFSHRTSTGDILEAVDLIRKSGYAELNVRAVVIYKAFATLKDEGFYRTLTVEITGDIHDADAARWLSDFGPLVRDYPTPQDCETVCMQRIARQKARDIAAIVADEGRRKLAALTRTGTGDHRNHAVEKSRYR